MPEKITLLKIGLTFLHSRWLLRGKKISELANLPPMKDPTRLAISAILQIMLVPASVTMPEFLGFGILFLNTAK